MRVLLASEGAASSSGVGTERYTFELQERLPRYGVAVRTAASNPSRKRFALAINAFTKLPAKVVISLDGVNLIHATDPSSALWAALPGTPSVATFHDLMSIILRSAHYGAGDRFFGTTSAKFALRCDRLIAVSKQTKQEMVHILGADSSKISVINLGVSSRFRRIAGVQKEEATVGYVGDITPRKRLDMLLRSFSLVKEKAPSAKLVVVGKGVAEFLSAETQKVQKMVQELGLGTSVEFKGRVSDEELAVLYNKMKVLVLTSEYEGFGLPIIEAERAGTPVVVRSGARLSEEVTTACLKAGSEEEIAAAVLRLIQDREGFAKISKAAVDHSLAFTWESCVSKTAEVYREVLSKR